MLSDHRSDTTGLELRAHINLKKRLFPMDRAEEDYSCILKNLVSLHTSSQLHELRWSCIV